MLDRLLWLRVSSTGQFCMVGDQEILHFVELPSMSNLNVLKLHK